MSDRIAQTVRVARPEDANAISAVLAASYGTLYRGWYRDEVLARALPAMTRANPRLLASGRYFVAEPSRRIVACGGWSLENPSGPSLPHVGHIRHFATHPDFLARGAGGAILARSLEDARAAGLLEMEVLSSLTAEAFYAGRGFQALEVVMSPMGGAQFACMRMRLRIG